MSDAASSGLSRHCEVWALPLVAWAGVLGLAWGGWNTEAFLWLNRWASGAPDLLWACLTMLGHTCVAFALLGLLLAARPQSLSAAMVSVLPASIYSVGLKRYFDEVRPAGVLELDSFHLIGEKLVSHSFPSGHTITAFAVAGAVWGSAALGARWQRALLLTLAASAGFSRIAVGAHWPMDVLMGAAGGWLAGLWGAWALSRWPVLDGAQARRAWLLVYAAMAVSLLWVDSGYPLADPMQYALAGLGFACAWHQFQRMRGAA